MPALRGPNQQAHMVQLFCDAVVLITQMHIDAREIFPEGLLDCALKIKQPFFTPIYDFTAPSIVFGRVAIVGDAAATAGHIWDLAWPKPVPTRKR